MLEFKGKSAEELVRDTEIRKLKLNRHSPEQEFKVVSVGDLVTLLMAGGELTVHNGVYDIDSHYSSVTFMGYSFFASTFYFELPGGILNRSYKR